MAQDKTASDPQEIAKFARIADEWWDPYGTFRPLHKFNPTRLAYIRRAVCRHFDRDAASHTPFKGLRVLDIGCGGGLLCEPMARLGADVCGVDMAAENIAAARTHAAAQGLDIDYQCSTVEQLKSRKKNSPKNSERGFDVVLNMEVIEHVAAPADFMRGCGARLAPDGIMFIATLNRTLKAYALAVLGAEYILRWLPRGTHDWNKFITPSELQAMLAAAGLEMAHSTGVSYNPLARSWHESGDMSVNYMGTAVFNSDAQ